MPQGKLKKIFGRKKNMREVPGEISTAGEGRNHREGKEKGGKRIPQGRKGKCHRGRKKSRGIEGLIKNFAPGEVNLVP